MTKKQFRTRKMSRTASILRVGTAILLLVMTNTCISQAGIKGLIGLEEYPAAEVSFLQNIYDENRCIRGTEKETTGDIIRTGSKTYCVDFITSLDGGGSYTLLGPLMFTISELKQFDQNDEKQRTEQLITFLKGVANYFGLECLKTVWTDPKTRDSLCSNPNGDLRRVGKKMNLATKDVDDMAAKIQIKGFITRSNIQYYATRSVRGDIEVITRRISVK